VHQTVQKTLKQLKTDCGVLEATIAQQLQQDAANRELNSRRTLHAAALVAGGLLALLVLGWALAARAVGALCSSRGGGGGGHGGGGVCSSGAGRSLLAADGALEEGVFNALVGGLLVALLVCGGGAGWSWRAAPVLDKRALKRLDAYRAAVARAKVQSEALWDEYFASLAEDR
jgi:hypothetical protein